MNDSAAYQLIKIAIQAAKKKRKRQKMSIRVAAEEIGMSPATLHRAETKHRISALHYVKILEWAAS